MPRYACGCVACCSSESCCADLVQRDMHINARMAQHVAAYMLWKYRDDPSADEKAALAFATWDEIEALAKELQL